MTETRYLPLVEELAAQIRTGRLPPGTRLPTHRRLAARHGIALVTATRVYAELEARGLVSGEVGRGTFVREVALPRSHGIDQLAVAGDAVDLNFNYPSLPGQARALSRALRQLAAAGNLEALLRYAPHGGRPHERASVARHLSSRGLAVDPEHVLIVDGAQHGLAVTAMAMLQPGDLVALDALTYPGFKVVADMLRLQLAPLPAAQEGMGMDLDALERLCARRRVRAVYVMPTLHNPLGWVSSLAWRRRLADIVGRHGLLAIEDAAYAFLAANAPAPLAALAPEATIHVSGLSKSVATGLRFGFVAAPPACVPKLERAIRATTWNTPGIVTALACNWLDDGTVSRLEAEKRKDASLRQAVAREALAGLAAVGHRASYFVWLPLPPEVRADRVAASLLDEGISVSTAEPFATSKQVPHAIRLALGSVQIERLRVSLRTVKAVVESLAC
ncbi:PLP-dependent aminotransferase family protein [Trinickia caryophylli]|uniref:Transcriptional regulator, GntR family n=1 Tax=Trinickia caryophylli TaxID=28094 RepID=A0A1X7GQV7_TRICW|nr:PLP-dependent aminotransferase family protein [Trinickia caryophylli]PMS10494.1 PLP-dependent aminotransferase family protein [Trinickia caryophylli]TRX19113.1 PLP-dependent aminotransferase family protein [Trinickia caryophylli]WQE13590.1 PLP-dependent aminotransferase family protein [Trinickia caryophylli]SMF72614.1 transcriptional regulator, GntR family [Trinickia caryophylli]GLU35104.1 GntR family transcriptional regulator [Trinickia caryophylli]